MTFLRRRNPGVFLRAAFLLALWMTAGSARAGQEPPPVVLNDAAMFAPAAPENEPKDDPEGEVEDPAAAENLAADQHEEIANYWIHMIESAAKLLQGRLDKGLALRVNYLEQTCGISPAQKRKIELAGRGDIARHFRIVEEKKQLLKRSLKDEVKLPQITSEIQTLSYRSPEEIFDAKSILAKTTKATLSAEQYRCYEEGIRAREELQTQVSLEHAVSVIDATIGLSEEQKGQFLTLLKKHVSQFKKLGIDTTDSTNTLLQSWRLPEASVKAILDDQQWHLMEHFRRHAQEEYGGGAGFDMITEKGVDPDLILRPAEHRNIVQANEGPNRPPCGAESLP